MGPSSVGGLLNHAERLARLETEVGFYKDQVKELRDQVADLEQRKDRLLGAQALLTILWPLVLAGILSYLGLIHKVGEPTQPGPPSPIERLEKEIKP